jgi:hypothetical protein
VVSILPVGALIAYFTYLRNILVIVKRAGLVLVNLGLAAQVEDLFAF